MFTTKLGSSGGNGNALDIGYDAAKIRSKYYSNLVDYGSAKS